MTKAKLPVGYSHSNQNVRFKMAVLQEEREQEEGKPLTLFDELCKTMTTIKDDYKQY